MKLTRRRILAYLFVLAAAACLLLTFTADDPGAVVGWFAGFTLCVLGARASIET